ncbi:hypothetical protein DL769_000470 [Monosporascus sp. CRB-8-3]|nr:hypothetical protein DL769_000470 [Monosporascus sp. CRB-8-3]
MATPDITTPLHGHPPTNPKLLANLIARVLLAIIGTWLCWVPLRMMARNGEFAAAVLVATVCILNLTTVVNSLLWRSDDWRSWPSGRGLCDLEVYLLQPLNTAYAAAVFALVRRLAGQVRLATALPAPVAASRQRALRRRATMVQALVIFSVPVVQIAFTWFDIAQRFVVATLVGCSAVYDNSWPKVLVFDVPPAVFAVAAVPYAYLTYARYRAISQVTKSALGPRNTPAALRASRTRRRLYNMCLAILTAYLPLQLFYLSAGVRETTAASAYRAYDLERVHGEDGSDVGGGGGGDGNGNPYPWSAILFVPSWLVPASAMNQAYVAIATAAVIFVFFGLGEEARGAYRRCALRIGLGRWWPALRRDEGGRAFLPNRRPEGFRYRRDDTADDTLDLDDILRESGQLEQDTAYAPVPPRTAAQYPRTRTSHRHTHSYVNTVANNHNNKRKNHARPDSASSAGAGSLATVPPSPLESTAVIRPIIPPRGSSLRDAGMRRFRLPSMPTLPTLPSLPSVISLGRRGKGRARSGRRDRSMRVRTGVEDSSEKATGTGSGTATGSSDRERAYEPDAESDPDHDHDGTPMLPLRDLQRIPHASSLSPSPAPFPSRPHATAQAHHQHNPGHLRPRTPTPWSRPETQFPPRTSSLTSASTMPADVAAPAPAQQASESPRIPASDSPSPSPSLGLTTSRDAVQPRDLLSDADCSTSAASVSVQVSGTGSGSGTGSASLGGPAQAHGRGEEQTVRVRVSPAAERRRARRVSTATGGVPLSEVGSLVSPRLRVSVSVVAGAEEGSLEHRGNGDGRDGGGEDAAAAAAARHDDRALSADEQHRHQTNQNQNLQQGQTQALDSSSGEPAVEDNAYTTTTTTTTYPNSSSILTTTNGLPPPAQQPQRASWIELGTASRVAVRGRRVRPSVVLNTNAIMNSITNTNGNTRSEGDGNGTAANGKGAAPGQKQ